MNKVDHTLFFPSSPSSFLPPPLPLSPLPPPPPLSPLRTFHLKRQSGANSCNICPNIEGFFNGHLLCANRAPRCLIKNEYILEWREEGGGILPQ